MQLLAYLVNRSDYICIILCEHSYKYVTEINVPSTAVYPWFYFLPFLFLVLKYCVYVTLVMDHLLCNYAHWWSYQSNKSSIWSCYVQLIKEKSPLGAPNWIWPLKKQWMTPKHLIRKPVDHSCVLLEWLYYVLQNKIFKINVGHEKSFTNDAKTGRKRVAVATLLVHSVKMAMTIERITAMAQGGMVCSGVIWFPSHLDSPEAW